MGVLKDQSEFQAAVSYPEWVLSTQLWLSERTANSFNHGTISSAPVHIFITVCLQWILLLDAYYELHIMYIMSCSIETTQ